MLHYLGIVVPPMDFKGQKLAEEVYQYAVAAFGIIGFIVGIITQDFSHTLYVFAAGVALVALLVLPPWGFYRRSPVQWLPEAKKPNAASAGDDAKKAK